MIGWGLAAVGVVGCGVALPDPDVRSVEPDRAYNGEQTPITVRGERFYPSVEVDVGQRGPPETDDDFQVALLGPEGADREISYPLVGVELIDWRTLVGVVDVGLLPGTYDIVVTSPTGRVGVLQGGFFVSDTRADRLELASESPLYTVNDLAEVEIALVDPAGARVFQDLPVDVWVERDGLPLRPREFDHGGWEDARFDEAGEVLSGSLGSDGFARVWVSVAEPGQITVKAAPSASRSGVRDGTLPLVWTTSDALSVELTLPGEDFVATAGESFRVGLKLVDEFGNLVTERSRLVLLTSACNALVDLVSLDLRGERTVDVALRRATQPDGACPVERLVVFNGGFASEPLSVVPGPTSRIAVVTGAGPFVAGEEATAALTPQDAWGNETDHLGAYELSDSVGGLLSFSCSAPFCDFVPVVAAEAVTLRAAAAGGVEGHSEAYDVVPGAVARAEVAIGRAEIVAGEAVDVSVRLWDAWGNAVSGDAGVEAVVESELGDALCEPTVGPTDDPWLSCTLTVARAGARLIGEVVVGERTFEVESHEVRVVNGPLSRASVVAAASSVVAGEPVNVSVSTFDAFGNPYVSQSTAEIELIDGAGRLSPKTVALDADGRGAGDLVFTRAGANEALARQGGVDLGRSAPIGVLPGPAVSLRLDVPPWAEVGASAEVSVRAVDGFGNGAAFDGAVAVAVDGVSDAPVEVAMAGGRAGFSVIWTDVQLDAGVRVSVENLQGDDAVVQVYRGCASGPQLGFALSGQRPGVVCFDSSVSEAKVNADFAGTAPGAAALARFGLRVAEGEGVSGPADVQEIALSAVGAYDLVALVVDAAGCGVTERATAWVAPDDGSPAGPIELRVDEPQVADQSGSIARVVEARDCRGQPPAQARVSLRTTRGSLLGGEPTGAGEAFALDAGGNAAVVLIPGAADDAGEAVVVAWAPHLAARGSASTWMLGDHRPPRVVGQDPLGASSGSVGHVSLRFSEEMDPDSLGLSTFSVIGSQSGPQPGRIEAVEVHADGSGADLRFAEPLETAGEAWTVLVGLAATDLAGNGLDGREAGVNEDYTAVFGALPFSDNVVRSCAASPSRFRPDGDPGPGDEADASQVTFEAEVSPVWWILRVVDADGEPVRHARVAAQGNFGGWSWDGRDDGGAVVANGAWQAQVQTDDGFGNRSEACVRTLSVDNRGLEVVR